jgi:hypothetical protein
VSVNTDTLRTLTNVGKLKTFIHEYASKCSDTLTDKEIRNSLKTYDYTTVNAAILYKNTKDIQYLNPFVIGLIKKQADPEYNNKLDNCTDSLNTFTDLYMDSLMLTEIVIAVEEAFKVTIL